LAAIVGELEAARSAWGSWLGSLSEEEFFRPRSYHGYDWTFATVPLEVQRQHDLEHGEQMAVWHRPAGSAWGAGPRPVLLAALAGARQELLAAAGLHPPTERDKFLACGEWTAKDVLGHVAEWERMGAEGVRLMAAGKPPDVEPILDMDAWNAAHVEARREQPWEEVWHDLHAARGALLAGVEKLARTELGREFPFPWGGRGTAYNWLRVFVEHDRGHARALRAVVGGDGE
jgi:hypothetical protein